MFEPVFALDVEMLETKIGGNRKNSAGRVVLVRSDPILTWTKVMDVFVKYEEEQITDYMTNWSKLEPWMIASGVHLDSIVDFIFQTISGHKLVTFAGASDFRALGISPRVVDLFASERIELQNYFKRGNGTPYGLGPLVEYYGYHHKYNLRPIIIRHNCVDDAQYTLRLYLDHHECGGVFTPSEYILSKGEYRRKYGIY